MWTAILTARCFTLKQQKYFQGAQTFKEQEKRAHCNDPFIEPFQETVDIWVETLTEQRAYALYL